MADNPNRDPVERLTDALVADLLSLSDAELLADGDREGERDAAVSRAVIAGALIRIAAGRPGKERNASRSGEHSDRRPGRDAAGLFKRVKHNDHGRLKELTLAARNGGGLSSRELEEIVRDLRELGAFGDNDPEGE
jgi:hypothetical protein